MQIVEKMGKKTNLLRQCRSVMFEMAA